MREPPRTKGRDEYQRNLDKMTEPMVKEWEAKGKPQPITNEDGSLEHNPESPYLSVDVAKDEKAALKTQARRAASLYKADTLFYQDSDPDDDGIVTVQWTFRERPETNAQKKKREAAEAEAKASEEASPDDETSKNPDEDEAGTDEAGTDEATQGRGWRGRNQAAS
jgi:hypothetical protein